MPALSAAAKGAPVRYDRPRPGMRFHIPRNPPIIAPPSHPSYIKMVQRALRQLSEKTSTSKFAILKFVCWKYNVGPRVRKINEQVCNALKKGITDGIFVRTSGRGVEGSFRLANQTTKIVKKNRAKIVKKTRAKMVKKQAVAKTNGSKHSKNKKTSAKA
uniref:H15 domain-containing protein n=2 Tax=Caenorhabditis tropicalis TaxID=1561998 RepID=A0A1I7TRX5_9PELO